MLSARGHWINELSTHYQAPNGYLPRANHPEMIYVYLPKQTVRVWAGEFTGYVEGQIIGISMGLYTVSTDKGWHYADAQELASWGNVPVVVEGVA